ncbi:MAG: tryptophan-rich sensory protein [Sphaerochaeta sp.]
MEKRVRLMSVVVAITYIAMITVNSLANILPIGGMGTGEVSDSYPNLFAPAGLTFSIWGVIYLLLALHTLYQFKEHDESIQIIFSISSIINVLWIFAWHYHKIALSLILMLILLVCLIRINDLIDLGATDRRSYVLLALPFSVYLGWITVATIANVTTLLVSVGFSGWGISEPLWTAIILVVGAGIGLLWALRRRDKAYLVTLIWAYSGILNKHISREGFSGSYPLVLVVVSLALVVFVVFLGLLIFRKKQGVA